MPRQAGGVGPTNRRDRLRAATVREIKDAARRHLVAEGPAGVSLRAIARDLGMTAPGLYRYFPSLDHLVAALITDLYAELCDEMEAARDELPADDAAGRMLTVCRAFRAWAVEHPREFALTFGSPIPGYRAPPRDPAHEAGSRFGAVFLGQFAQLYARRPFDVPAEHTLNAGVRAEMDRWRRELGAELPLGVMYVFLTCWVRLYGLVTMEVFSHLDFALAEPEPFFEQQLEALGAALGIRTGYRPPAA